MLYWGLFTSGFIIGVMFTLFVIFRKEEKPGLPTGQNAENTADILEGTPNKIFDQLTKVNYITGQEKLSEKQISFK